MAPVSPAQRQNFLNLCSEANTIVDLAERRFSAWLSSIAIAYSDAWHCHTKFITNIGTKTKFTQDLLLGAALAFIPGAAGGVVGDAMRNCKDLGRGALATALTNKIPIVGSVMKDLSMGAGAIDGTKDLIKWGLRSGAIVGSTSITVPISDPFTKFPTDPMQWQNAINQRVQQELAQVTETIASWQRKANMDDPNFDMSFSPVNAVKAALIVTSKNLKSTTENPGFVSEQVTGLTTVAKDTTSKVFQAGFLVSWIVHCGFKAYCENSQVSWSGFIGNGVSGDIVERGEALGLTGVRAFLDKVVSDDLTKHNLRVLASGHGLI